MRPNHTSGAGVTPLGAAALRGHTFVIHALLRRGAHCDVSTSAEAGRVSPLMLAAGAGRLRAVALLLERGSDASLRDVNGRTAWDRAAGHPRVQWLLAAHAAGAASGGALAAARAHPAAVHVRLDNSAAGDAPVMEGQREAVGVGSLLAPLQASEQSHARSRRTR
uniref:Ankyrin repeat domain-containing protein n=1 Tax=Cafeteria roenbergensis TaxID=33653 RepID=A0A7S0K0I8_CAFRO